LFVVARGPCTNYGARAHIMFQLYVESHCHFQKKYEAKDRELEELMAGMKQAGEIMTVMGRLLSNGEVSSLAEIKKKSSPKIKAAIEVAARHVRDIVWTKRKMLLSGYSMYSEDEGTYYSERMGVVKAFIPPVWNPASFWHVFIVSVTKSLYNSMRSEATWGMKRTATGESKAMPVACFMN
jgi:hypothetical protein